MFRHIIVWLPLLIYTVNIFAQPACADNPAAADFCTNAIPICNLNGYCGNTSSSYTAKVSAANTTDENNAPLSNVFCATIQNNSWVKFVASETSAVFSVWVSDCSNNKGIQMRIYYTTDCYNFTPVSNCWNPLTPTNGQITATGLIPGQVYYFMIDGANGDVCDYVIAATSGVNTAPAVSPSKQICAGQTTSLSATGGDDYIWTSIPNDQTLAAQSTNSTITVNPSVTTTYSVSVYKDGENTFCDDANYNLSTTVTVNPIPDINITANYEHCHNNAGTLTALIENTSGPFSFSWNTTPAQHSQAATGLTSGTYLLTVTDSHGCSSISSQTLTNIDYLVPVIANTTALCYGGTAVLDAGTGYLTYLWSTGSNNQTIQSSTAGIFSVTVTAENNCIGSDTVSLNVIQVYPSISGNQYICPSDSTILGSSEIFRAYYWSTGETTPSIVVYDPGFYGLTVTDFHGCTGSTQVDMWNNQGPFVGFATTDEMRYKSNGTAIVRPNGGTGNYTYLWSNGFTDSIITNISAGKYFATVSDGNCQIIDSVIVYMQEGPTADFGIYQDEIILVDEYVTAEFYDNSSGDVINWYWYFGDGEYSEYTSTASHNYQNSGVFDVTHIIEDTDGCYDTVVKPITVRDYFTVYIPNCFVPYGEGVNSCFYPIGQGWDSENFEMYIFDRWGLIVFQSKDINNCKWNGTFNNTGSLDEMTDSMYIYLIRVKEQDALVHEYRGCVTLLK